MNTRLNLKQIKSTKNILIRVKQEYTADTSEKYLEALDRTIDLLRDIQSDLAERS